MSFCVKKLWNNYKNCFDRFMCVARFLFLSLPIFSSLLYYTKNNDITNLGWLSFPGWPPNYAHGRFWSLVSHRNRIIAGNNTETYLSCGISGVPRVPRYKVWKSKRQSDTAVVNNFWFCKVCVLRARTCLIKI